MCSRTVYYHFVIPVILILVGCSTHLTHDLAYVSDSIRKRTGHNLVSIEDVNGLKLPDGIVLTDGLTEDEAVAIALWNNAGLQADLTGLGFARADLIEAGMISNPVSQTLFASGPKQMESTLLLPIESLWQRPYRVSAAKLSAERVAENLVQNSLNLIRDVMITYSNFAFTLEQIEIVREEIELDNEILAIAQVRLRAGDISGLEEAALRLEAAQKQRTFIDYTRGVAILDMELKTLIGMAQEENTIKLTPTQIDVQLIYNLDELLTLAYEARPDLRAAEIAIEAAGKRLGWERSKIFKFTAIADFNERGRSGPEFGPGALFDLPVFNWNNGKVARSKVQLEQAVRQYVVVKREIAFKVREAYTNYLSALKALKILRSDILPSAVIAVNKAEKRYSVGEISYLEFLGFKRQLLYSRLGESESMAELRRASAQLRHSVGFIQDILNTK